MFTVINIMSINFIKIRILACLWWFKKGFPLFMKVSFNKLIWKIIVVAYVFSFVFVYKAQNLSAAPVVNRESPNHGNSKVKVEVDDSKKSHDVPATATADDSNLDLKTKPSNAKLLSTADLIKELDLILKTTEQPRTPLLDDSPLFCLGSRVLYPVPLPPFPFTERSWLPQRPIMPDGEDGDYLSRCAKKIDDGKYKEAQSDLENFSRRFPDSTLKNHVQYYDLEASMRSIEKVDKSNGVVALLEKLRGLIRKDQKHKMLPRLMFLAGQLYMDLKYYPEASSMYRRLLVIYPENSDKAEVMQGRFVALKKLAWSESSRFSDDESIKYFRQALPLAKGAEQGEVVLLMSASIAHKGHYHKLRKLLDFIAETWPTMTTSLAYRVLDAESYYRVDNLKEAKDAYQALHDALKNKNPLIYDFRLGEVSMMQGKYKDARKFFATRSREEDPALKQWQDAMMELRMLQMDMDDKSVSRRLISLEKLRKLRLENSFAPIVEEVLVEYVKYYMSLENLPDALGMLQSLLSSYRENTLRSILVERIWRQVEKSLREDLRQDRLLSMLGLYERAYSVLSKERSYSPEAAYLVAESYSKLGLYDQAYKVLSEAFLVEGATQVLTDRALLLMADVKRGQKKFNDARHTLELLRKRTNDSISLLLAILEDAKILEEEGKLQEAANVYQRYATSVSDPLLAFNTLKRIGLKILSQKGCSQAIGVFSEAAKFAKNISTQSQIENAADVFYQQGECLFKLERYNEAIEAFSTGISKKSNHKMSTYARYAMANSYSKLQRNQDAERIYRALSKEKNSDDVWVKLSKDTVEQLDWSRQTTQVN